MSERSYPVGGYAPGLYECECSSCGVVFTGDKHAYQCLDCVALDQKEQITRLREQLAEAEGQEPVAFTCHGNSAPAYSCNKPGDMSGMYYRNPAPAKVPDILFDGYAVYQALAEGKAKQRTSADNVSDVLDAVVRLLKQQEVNNG